MHEIAQVRANEGEILPLVEQNFEHFSQLLNDNHLSSTITLGLFWGAVGTFVYFLITLLGRLVNDARHMVVEELTYVQPDAHQIRKQRFDMGVRVVERLGILITSLFIVLIGLELILPLAIQTFDVFVSDWSSVTAFLNAALALVSVVAVMYLAGSGFRLLFEYRK